jgi:hypothetical protein
MSLPQGTLMSTGGGFWGVCGPFSPILGTQRADAQGQRQGSFLRVEPDLFVVDAFSAGRWSRLRIPCWCGG